MVVRRMSAKELHEELQSFYWRFRGTMAPSNTYTQSIWAEIERLEGQRG